MNYKETLDYLYARLPMFSRIGAAAYKADLENIKALCNALGNPENKFKSIHIAGTNGKGSVSHLLASVFQEAGYKTGLYTSPHLVDFRERIRINGGMIPEEYVVSFTEKNKMLFEEINPSFFEATQAIAFSFFSDEKIDIAIIETGLGGRLDSTNITMPELSVITNISFDHQNFLGNTLPLIAAEKAGIIKHKTPVVVGKKNHETDEVFISKAIETGSEIFFAENHFEMNKAAGEVRFFSSKTSGENIEISSPLTGEYQSENFATALAALYVMKEQGWSISSENIYNGFNNVKTNTGIRGRWEVLQSSPLIVADVAHNEAGLQAVTQQAKTLDKALHIVYGCVNDKDLDKALSVLPAEAIYYFCKPDIPRGMDASVLQQKANEKGLSGKHYSSVSDALQAAQSATAAEDMILITGSFFVVGEALEIMSIN